MQTRNELKHWKAGMTIELQKNPLDGKQTHPSGVHDWWGQRCKEGARTEKTRDPREAGEDADYGPKPTESGWWTNEWSALDGTRPRAAGMCVPEDQFWGALPQGDSHPVQPGHFLNAPKAIHSDSQHGFGFFLLAATVNIFKTLWGPMKTCQQTRFDTQIASLPLLIWDMNKAIPEKEYKTE